MGNKKSIHISPWPTYDESLTKDTNAKIAVQVNGKVRAVIEVAADADETAVKTAAYLSDDVRKWLAGKTPAKIIYVKNKIINFIVV
jgi:leucyl-tRNA synthetase